MTSKTDTEISPMTRDIQGREPLMDKDFVDDDLEKEGVTKANS